MKRIMRELLEMEADNEMHNIRVGKSSQIPFIYSGVTLDNSGLAFAAAALTTEKDYIVILDERIFKSDKVYEGYKEFFVAHELGHVKHNHLMDEDANLAQKRIEAIERGEVLKMELEADAFAYKAVGYKNALASLKYMRNVMLLSVMLQPTDELKYKTKLSAKEVKLRIKAIKALHKKLQSVA